VLLYDKTFWQGMLDWMQERMLDADLIGAHDLDRLIFCNKPAEAVAALMHEDGSLRGTEYGGSMLIARPHAPL
jgi:predicted Rossmann-fold nucleotide-binding protein